MLHNPETGLISIVYKGISAHRPVVIPIAPGIEIPLGPEKTLCKELIILSYNYSFCQYGTDIDSQISLFLHRNTLFASFFVLPGAAPSLR